MAELTARAIAIIVCLIVLGALLVWVGWTAPRGNPQGAFQTPTPAASVTAVAPPSPTLNVPRVTPQPNGQLTTDDNEKAWAFITIPNVQAACVQGLKQAMGQSNVQGCTCDEQASPTVKNYKCQGQTSIGSYPVKFDCDKTAQTCKVNAPGAAEQTYTFAQLLQIAQQQNG